MIPAYINLDCHHNYPASEGPANARDTGSISRLNNGVHPNDAGYQQIGDSIYAWMLARCAE